MNHLQTWQSPPTSLTRISEALGESSTLQESKWNSCARDVLLSIFQTTCPGSQGTSCLSLYSMMSERRSSSSSRRRDYGTNLRMSWIISLLLIQPVEVAHFLSEW